MATAGTRKAADERLKILMDYIPASQRAVLRELAAGEEGDFYRGKIAEVIDTIEAMPVTYKGDGIARLHYFTRGADWWITEKDAATDGRNTQAFGLADLGFGFPELGYIDLEELTRHPAVELDLYWTPRAAAEIRDAR